MNRREFLAAQAATVLGVSAFLDPLSSSVAWALSRHQAQTDDPYSRIDWKRMRVEPVALPPFSPNGTFLPFAYPDPVNPDWPQQMTPDFTREFKHVAGVRPFRRGGFRLERTSFDGGRKTLVHNYGHGGAGITLSWGVAELTVERMADIAPGTDVAVLGGGIVGLATAAVLVERGYRVRVYARDFHPQVTSSVAGGQFAPSVVETPAGILLNDVILRSWKRFAAQEDQGVGVSYVPNFSTGTGGGFNRFPRGTIPGGRAFRLPRLPFAGPARAGSFAWTLLIETPIYLPWLTRKLTSEGVGFHQREFSTHADLASLSEPVVVNCLGLGAKTLFGDTQLTGVRGQLVLLEPQDLGYLLSFEGGYIFSRQDAVVVGGTFEYGEERVVTTPAARRAILRRGQAFYGLSNLGSTAR